MAAPSSVLRERIARHGLTALGGRPCSTAEQAVALTTAVQAQDNQASRLGVRSRTNGVTEADVVTAIEIERSITRTWLLRGTIHLVATSDLRWLVRLIGPAVDRKYRTRWRQIGLSDDLLDRMLGALPEVLADGALTRHEIRTAMTARGLITPTTDPQAPTHAMVHASTTGVICRGPDRGRDSTFVLTSDWLATAKAGVHDELDGDDAIAELARRYFAAYSPATAADFAVWSGLAGARSVGMIRDELTVADVFGAPGFRLGTAPAATRGQVVTLLAAFDNYLIGYRDRHAILHGPDYRRVYDGGIIRPAVLVDGEVVGIWSLDRPRRRVTVTPFGLLSAAVVRAVEAEGQDVARFTGLDLDVTVRQAVD